MQKKVERQKIGHYQIIGSLGKGATAEVYLVENENSAEKYALKVCDKREVVEAEAAVLKQLQCNVFPRFGEYLPEESALIMEYIEGKSLQELLDRDRQFETAEIMYIMQEVLRGLGYLHRCEPQMIYRDLKPANIMIEKNGRIRLIDVGGVVSLKQQSSDKIVHAGTYGYAAPEQFWPGMEPEPPCDVYAAGKLLVYLFTGKNPVEPPYHMEGFQKGNLRIPEAFREVIERCLAMNPQARYEDAGALWTALQKAQELSKKRKWFSFRRRSLCIYEKCIWKSEYHKKEGLF